MQLLAAAQGDDDLGAPAAETHFERHDGESLALDGADEVPDLARMQQQLARTRGLVVPDDPCSYGEMWRLSSQSSPSFTTPYASVRLALPLRSDFTSVPRSTRPASHVSRIS